MRRIGCFLCFLFLLMAFGACSGSGNQSVDGSFLDVPGSLGSIPIDFVPPGEGLVVLPGDSVIEDYFFVPLETTSDMLMGMTMFTNRIFFTDSRMVIVDLSRGHMYIYDRQGKAVGSISNQGKGPEDYLSLNSVAFDHVTELIHVYNYSRRNVHLYNLEGAYVRTESTGNEFQSGSGHLLFKDYAVVDRGMSVNEFEGFKQYSFYDRENYRHIGSHFTIPTKYRGDGHAPDLMLDVADGALYCLSVFENGIFMMSPDGVQKLYDFDIPEKYRLTREKMEIEEGSVERVYLVRQPTPTIDRIKDFYVTSDFISFTCGMTYHIVYSRSTGRVKCFNTLSLKNEASLGIFLYPVAKDGDYLVQFIHPDSYNFYSGDSIDSESNPVLMFYKYKKF